MKARKIPWRKIRNAALFAALGYVISITNLVLPAALAAGRGLKQTREICKEKRND